MLRMRPHARIIEFALPRMEAMGGEMELMQQLAHARKIAQDIFIARKQ
jgi:hypothetical protein